MRRFGACGAERSRLLQLRKQRLTWQYSGFSARRSSVAVASSDREALASTACAAGVRSDGPLGHGLHAACFFSKTRIRCSKGRGPKRWQTSTAGVGDIAFSMARWCLGAPSGRRELSIAIARLQAQAGALDWGAGMGGQRNVTLSQCGVEKADISNLRTSVTRFATYMCFDATPARHSSGASHAHPAVLTIRLSWPAMPGDHKVQLGATPHGHPSWPGAH